MEVHHHSHTPRKKWSHYFWEFFMLFLAVFCGFLAENQREHYVEHQREKQFIRSLAEDLATDTVELKRAIGKADTVIRFSDSAVRILRSHVASEKIPAPLVGFVGRAGQNQNLINTDRTSSQLKNSGAMRLIRNREVSNLILAYWKQIEQSNISLERYMLYRNASRELVFKLWVIPEVYGAGSLERGTIEQYRVIDQDPKKWDELTNLIAISGTITRQAHIINLSRQLTTARDLLSLMQKEYHLK